MYCPSYYSFYNRGFVNCFNKPNNKKYDFKFYDYMYSQTTNVVQYQIFNNLERKYNLGEFAYFYALDFINLLNQITDKKQFKINNKDFSQKDTVICKINFLSIYNGVPNYKINYQTYIEILDYDNSYILYNSVMYILEAINQDFQRSSISNIIGDYYINEVFIDSNGYATVESNIKLNNKIYCDNKLVDEIEDVAIYDNITDLTIYTPYNIQSFDQNFLYKCEIDLNYDKYIKEVGYDNINSKYYYINYEDDIINWVYSKENDKLSFNNESSDFIFNS